MTREELRTYHREWRRKQRAADPEADTRRRAEYRLANYARVREQERRSRTKHREKRNEEAKEYQRKMRSEQPERQREIARKSRYRKKYGLTIEAYEALFAQQNNACAICAGQSKDKKWHTDHCHTAGHVRGILCSACNLMLGHAQDKAETLRRAADYLDCSRNSDAQL